MKTIYLIRHAKSSWNFDLDDHDRPVGVRGRRDLIKMGIYLSQNEPTPELIITSTASRCLYTALYLGDDWGYPETEIQLTKNLYQASLESLLELISKTDADSVVIVGHNPGLTELANLFAHEYLDNIPTCGVVRFELNAPDWQKALELREQKFLFKSPKRL